MPRLRLHKCIACLAILHQTARIFNGRILGGLLENVSNQDWAVKAHIRLNFGGRIGLANWQAVDETCYQEQNVQSVERVDCLVCVDICVLLATQGRKQARPKLKD